MSESKEMTVAEKIWFDIKDKPINMFALKNQTPAKYCQPLFIEPNRLYLTFSIGSVLPALETAFGEYNIEMSGQFIFVSPKSTQ